MTTATIYLAPHRILREIFLDKEKIELVRAELPNYCIGGRLETTLTGEDAADEAFDLTNNPSREDERQELYGHDRSVSSGDVIDVDGVKYVCLSFGWAVL